MIRSTLLLIVIFFILSTSAQASTSVWKVSKGSSYIYIGGTVHILPPSELPLPTAFDHAYQQSDVIVFEAPLPDPNNIKAQHQLMQQLSYPAGETLKKHINRQTYQSLKTYFARHNMLIENYLTFKPGFLVMMMVTLEAQKHKFYGEGVDAFFMRQAKANNKKLSYLETSDFQINMLANMGSGNENQLLQINLKQMDEFSSMMTKLLKAWRNGDLMVIEKLMLAPAKKEDPKSYQQLFKDRNIKWLPKITRLLDNNEKAFVLVGAGHLAGDNNVLSLLKQQGFKVSQL